MGDPNRSGIAKSLTYTRAHPLISPGSNAKVVPRVFRGITGKLRVAEGTKAIKGESISQPRSPNT